MSKAPFSKAFPFLCLFTVLQVGTLVAFNTPSVAEVKTGKAKGPITVTASTLTADNKARTALFEGSVVAKTDTITMYSDRMTVYYSEDNKVTKIEAAGHLKVVSGERVITSQAATYLADAEEIIFTGQPKAVEGKNMVTGTRMIYRINEDRSIVENSRVFMEKEAVGNR